MWIRDRPNWQGGLSGALPKATATDGRQEWPFCGGGQCFADLQSGEPPDAITAPHWNE